MIDAYFTDKYDGLCKYARRLIQDKKRTYSPEEVVNEAYLYVRKNEKVLMDKIDGFCKAWIKFSIVRPRTFVNLKMSLTNFDGTEKAEGMKGESIEVLTDEEFLLVLEMMPKRRADIIRLLLECDTLHKCCVKTGMQKLRMKKEISLARTSFYLTRKQLIN